MRKLGWCVTEEDRKAEMARARAASVYNAMYQCRVQEQAARKAFAKWGNHQAFKQYMVEMGLENDLEAFIARPSFNGA